MITIVDYGMGNHGSIRNMLHRLGQESLITSDPEVIRHADRLILPGVGHFGRAMANLEGLGLVDALDEAVLRRKVPILGICLGMQLMTRHGEEGNARGLGWIDAMTRRLVADQDERLQIPHMGWNSLVVGTPSPILDGRDEASRYYFVHSYAVHCDDGANVAATTRYGQPFHSAIIRDHIMGVQFHPEKSHKYGYRLLENFCCWRQDGTSATTVTRQLVSRTDVVAGKSPATPSALHGTSPSSRPPARIIPLLLLRGRGLVKTTRFKDPQYVGDPRNAVKIFNEKEVDELAILDVEATVAGREPDYELLADVISEAFMPVAYGGGLHTLEQCRRVLGLGAEKIFLNTAAVEDPDLVRDASSHFGAQSVVAVVDVRQAGLFRKQPRVCCRRGRPAAAGMTPVEFARRMAELGAGELLVQSIDHEGTQRGFDIDLVRDISSAVDIPVIATGGAGCLEDLRRVLIDGGASAVAVGSMFVYQGPHRAVLINYPKQDALARLFAPDQ